MEPATEQLEDAEQNGTAALGKLLRARVPTSWPPHVFAPPKPEPGAVWLTLYLVNEPEGGEAMVIGVAGLAHWPAETKTVQFGMALLPESQGKGFGEKTSVVFADWAISQPGVSRIVCDIPMENPAAAECLRKAGYSPTEESVGSGFVRWERRKS